jgi:hypothetical protein
MGMPAEITEWTAAMARALPDDGNRYEVLDGELFVSPAPSWTHQSAVEELHLIIAPHVRAHRIGYAKLSPSDIEFSPTRLVQPDLFVVPWREGGRPRTWREFGSLVE